jgi:hypothetical protein
VEGLPSFLTLALDEDERSTQFPGPLYHRKKRTQKAEKSLAPFRNKARDLQIIA